MRGTGVVRHATGSQVHRTGARAVERDRDPLDAAGRLRVEPGFRLEGRSRLAIHGDRSQRRSIVLVGALSSRADISACATRTQLLVRPPGVVNARLEACRQPRGWAVVQIRRADEAIDVL